MESHAKREYISIFRPALNACFAARSAVDRRLGHEPGHMLADNRSVLEPVARSAATSHISSSVPSIRKSPLLVFSHNPDLEATIGASHRSGKRRPR
jgi:hypothetical protein